MILNEENGALVGNYARLQARYWADASFDQGLKANSDQILKEYGIDFGPGVSAQVVVNSSRISYFILPARPEGLSNSQVNELAAAGTFGTGGTVGSAGTICGCAATFGTLGTFGCSSL